MEKIKKENINGDTPLNVVIEYLKQNISDKHSRTLMSEFEQGLKIGELRVLDMLVSLRGKDNA